MPSKRTQQMFWCCILATTALSVSLSVSLSRFCTFCLKRGNQRRFTGSFFWCILVICKARQTYRPHINFTSWRRIDFHHRTTLSVTHYTTLQNGAWSAVAICSRHCSNVYVLRGESLLILNVLFFLTNLPFWTDWTYDFYTHIARVRWPATMCSLWMLPWKPWSVYLWTDGE